jgi:integrase
MRRARARARSAPRTARRSEQLEDGERPKLSAGPKRRIYTREELQQTLAATREPWHTLFAFAAVTGARQGECLGLVWRDLELDDVADATASFELQVDRQGRRQPLKTDESRRTIELPRQLATMLVQHKLASPHSNPDDFVFASRSGRALAQRNVLRALRRAQELAVDESGRATFQALHERDERDEPLAVPRGALPNFHSFRHTAVSHAIAAGESAEELSWQLGHRNSVVTRAVYVHELKTAERAAQRRQRLEAQSALFLTSIPTGVEASDPS